jgi:hypothetical protein
MFHVSYALIFGLKDEAYDEGIIVHVLFGWDNQVRCAHFSDVLPCQGGVPALLNASCHSLLILLSQLCNIKNNYYNIIM